MRVDPPSDLELTRRARDGDDHAFRELVDRYESRVAATVVGMLGPGPDAEDVGQETFIRFHAALGRFRGEAALGTYLTRIAINLSLNASKRRQKPGGGSGAWTATRTRRPSPPPTGRPCRTGPTPGPRCRRRCSSSSPITAPWWCCA